MWSWQSGSRGNKPHPVIPLLFAALSIGAAMAAPVDDLSRASLPQMLEWLDVHHPELAAARLEQDAAEARIQPATALPDPMLSVEWRDIRYDSPTLDPTQVGSMRYQFRQSIPLWGKRELRGQVAQSGVNTAQAARTQVRLNLRNQLQRAHAQWVAARETARQLDALQQVMSDAERLARTRYAAGLVAQSEVLRAQTELASLQNDQAAAQSTGRRATARLNALLLRPSDAVLMDPAGFSPVPEKMDWRRLIEQLEGGNPQLQLAVAQIDASTRTAELTRRNRWPDLTVGVAPMQTGSRFDSWELMLEINLPLQQETRRSQEREASLMRDAAVARQAATRTGLQGDLSELRAAYETALHHAHVLESSVLPQIELSWRAAQIAYNSGAGDFSSLIEMQRAWRRARIDLLNAALDARLTLADIELRVGGAL